MSTDTICNIQYVCLSDLHLGEEDSLLTDIDPNDGRVNLQAASPVLQLLPARLESLLAVNQADAPKPTLILNGDILELALARTHQALGAFEWLVQLLMPQGQALFDKTILFIPGNHDHHFWEMGREQQYLKHIQGIMPPASLPEMYHTTGMFSQAKGFALPESGLLTKVANRATNRTDLQVVVAYPNYAILPPVRGVQKCVVFHHGHFVEPIYQLMSELRTLVFPGSRKPDDIYELEGENFAWIDFFWSALGRSGKVGEDLEAIYEKRKNWKELQKLLKSIALELARRCDIPLVPEFLEDDAFALILEKLAKKFAKLERERGAEDFSHPKLPLSDDAQKGLADYIDRYLYGQIKGEEPSLLDQHDNLVDTVSFVFGHTHKPFASPLRFCRRYHGRVPVYNTGGWVVENPAPDPVHGGSVVLVDQNLDVVNVRLYSERSPVYNEGSPRPPYVEEAIPPGDPHSNLYKGVSDTIKTKTNAGAWRTFSQEVHRAIHVRAENLRRRIHSRV